MLNKQFIALCTANSEILLDDTDMPGISHKYAQQIARVPQHPCCMLLPEGILTAEEMEEAVSLILDFQDIFVGPDGKWVSLNR